jgi:fibronectin type 3 domain-containing protein
MVLAMLPYSSASAQAPPVPATFQDLYSSLNTYLTNFNATLGSPNGSTYPTLMTGSLKAADANVGPRLLNGANGMELQLNALKALGAQAVMVEIGFPMLYQPFLTSQGQSYAAYVAYYAGVAAAVRQAGLKLIIENDSLLSNDVSAGWNAVPFYATLNWTEYQQARAQTAAVIAQTMHPDYMVVLEEPSTEARNSGQVNVSTPSGATAMLSQILTSLQQASVANLKVGAGVPTWQDEYLAYVQDFVTLPVDFIDMHIYPVNQGQLPNALQIASAAAAAGKPVSMSECWMWKVRDSELGVLTDQQIRARNPFGFWAPLDAYFIETVQNLASRTRMLFLDFFGSEYYFAYQPYGASTENLPPAQILGQEGSLVSTANQQALYTSTGMSYYHSVVVPADTTPPSAPAGLSGASANPTTAYLSWSPATDNVGVAGYYVLRNGSVVGTTANVNYQDSGLTQSKTYTYWIEAFDLAGNVSAPSQRIAVTTKDVTPPSTPGNVVATAASCQKVTLTWSPSTDNGGVGSYLIFSGLSPTALTQAGRTASTTTSYTSHPLTPGTTYYYGVQAADTSGNVSSMSAVVTATTPVPPAAPTNLAEITISTGRIGLTWTPAATGGLPVQSYHVFRGGSAADLSPLAVVSQPYYTDTSVKPAATYYYGVQAADTAGDLSPMSAIILAKTPAPPAAPANLVATLASTGVIGLTWSAATSGGLPVQNYYVYRGTKPSNLSKLAMVQQTSYQDTTVTAATKYYYAVVAADIAGDLSPMSAIVTAGGSPASSPGVRVW